MKYSVLLISENDQLSSLVLDLLEFMGYDVHYVSGGKNGISKALNVQPDLVLCDQSLESINCYAIINILRSKDVLNNTSFIVLAEDSSWKLYREARRNGADDYLVKPINYNNLINAIRSQLERYGKGSYESCKDSYSRSDFDNKLGRLIKTNRFEVIAVRRKHVLQQEGETARNVYYVNQGVFGSVKNNNVFKDQIIGLYTSGHLIGAIDILLNRRCHVSIESMTDAMVTIIPKQAVESINNKDLVLLRYCFEDMAAEMDVLKTRFSSHSYASVRIKVARALVELQQIFGNEPIGLIKRDIARYAGTVEETVYRILSDFTKSKLINQDKGIRVIDQEGLFAICD